MVWFIGLMSGTSLDGVDGVLAQAAPGGQWQAVHHRHRPFTDGLRAELLALNRSGADELHRSAVAAHALVNTYSAVVHELLASAGVAAAAVRAIGAHGQTVRHRPGVFGDSGYTLQLMNGAQLAERTGIDVVCDLRSRDVAAGGQGAPLVPAFHAATFARAGEATAVLNLGGIANLTLLGASGEVLGFDTGPGNLLMDLWAQRHLGQPCDRDGAWAATGHVSDHLLQSLLADGYFALPPPKSTGRDHFHADWLDARLAGLAIAPADVMATLAELTACSVVDALRLHAAGTRRLLVCGGGAFNGHLMRRLTARAAAGAAEPCRVASTADAGVPPDQVEALAFAWLARAFVERRPGNLPGVTGARGPRLLGALYPA